jgi:F0F1-type ATP synthase membrane subunit a
LEKTIAWSYVVLAISHIVLGNYGKDWASIAPGFTNVFVAILIGNIVILNDKIKLMEEK